MGNRLSSGSTGDFTVRVFLESEASSTAQVEEEESPVSIGQAVYTRGGEYSAGYNVSETGDYALHVSFNCHRMLKDNPSSTAS